MDALEPHTGSENRLSKGSPSDIWSHSVPPYSHCQVFRTECRYQSGKQGESSNSDFKYFCYLEYETLPVEQPPTPLMYDVGKWGNLFFLCIGTRGGKCWPVRCSAFCWVSKELSRAPSFWLWSLKPAGPCLTLGRSPVLLAFIYPHQESSSKLGQKRQPLAQEISPRHHAFDCRFSSGTPSLLFPFCLLSHLSSCATNSSQIPIHIQIFAVHSHWTRMLRCTHICVFCVLLTNWNFGMTQTLQLLESPPLELGGPLSIFSDLGSALCINSNCTHPPAEDLHENPSRFLTTSLYLSTSPNSCSRALLSTTWH